MSNPREHCRDPAETHGTALARDYPDLPASERTRWILDRREPRASFDVWRPHDSFVELERSASGELLSTLILLLRSRECPWHCLMCDLWKSTVSHPIPSGAIPAQLDVALAGRVHPQLVRSRQIKLYNSGSFFDAGAVPPADYPAIAQRLREFERVIVECHPRLLGQRALQFHDLLDRTAARKSDSGVCSETPAAAPQLEVAMGLETVHPIALERLNKGMTLEDFRRAADFLLSHQIDLRAFVLVQPPFVPASEALEWVERSVNFAFDSGATAVSLIPTRPGNGAIDALLMSGCFSLPKIALLEQALDQAVALLRGRVFADLWDLERFSDCSDCFSARRDRLESVNREQSTQAPITCPKCGHGC